MARELSRDRGILEPLQTAPSLDGQVNELRQVLEENADRPAALIGHSWGALLGFIFAARFPQYVRKLSLVGSAVYEERYAVQIDEVRLSRLTHEERQEAHSLIADLEAPMEAPTGRNKDARLRRLGQLFTKAGTYDPLPSDEEVLEVQADLFRSVWAEARDLRVSGELLRLGKSIRCPVVAIHGDYDPHPAEGVRDPLSVVLADFRFVLLENCGHMPWIEKQARDRFYGVLRQELGDDHGRCSGGNGREGKWHQSQSR